MELNVGCNIVLYFDTQEIGLYSPIKLECVYYILKGVWAYNKEAAKYEFPLRAITPGIFDFINGWSIIEGSIDNIRESAFISGNKKYCSIVELGSPYVAHNRCHQIINDKLIGKLPFNATKEVLGVKTWDTYVYYVPTNEGQRY